MSDHPRRTITLQAHVTEHTERGHLTRTYETRATVAEDGLLAALAQASLVVGRQIARDEADDA